MNKCTICGTELVDGKCPNTHVAKPMCLNCIWMNSTDENYSCVNQNVLNLAVEKMMAALPEGYEVENLTMKPMALKNPCKKCGNHELNKEMVVRRLLEDAGIAPEEYLADKNM